MESVRRVTQVLEVKQAGAIVPIDLVLPSEAKECFGLQAIVSGLFPGVESVIDFGEYSVSFNGRQNHPIHQLVPYESAQARQVSTTRIGLLPLSAALVSGSPVTGFYRDLGRQQEPFIPYQVRISFNLITE